MRTSLTIAEELTPSRGSELFGQHAREMDSRPKRFWVRHQ